MSANHATLRGPEGIDAMGRTNAVPASLFVEVEQSVLTMLGAYPTILFLLITLEPLLGGASKAVRAAVLVPLMVLSLRYVVIPLLTRLSRGLRRNRRELAGHGSVSAPAPQELSRKNACP